MIVGEYLSYNITVKIKLDNMESNGCHTDNSEIMIIIAIIMELWLSGWEISGEEAVGPVVK